LILEVFERTKRTLKAELPLRLHLDCGTGLVVRREQRAKKREARPRQAASELPSSDWRSTVRLDPLRFPKRSS
jgi:hypothetical protein